MSSLFNINYYQLYTLAAIRYASQTILPFLILVFWYQIYNTLWASFITLNISYRFLRHSSVC